MEKQDAEKERLESMKEESMRLLTMQVKACEESKITFEEVVGAIKDFLLKALFWSAVLPLIGYFLVWTVIIFSVIADVILNGV
nr:MAG TPA: hypothetical protein [Caudoviricetes sp.]